MSVELTDDKGVLASSQLDEFDVCVFGTGFTRTVSQPDGAPKRSRTSHLNRKTDSSNSSVVERDWSAFTERRGGLADAPLTL